MEEQFLVFTDGSVIGNPGLGGWAAVLMHRGKSWEMSGSSPLSTISEMELMAAVETLRTIPDEAHVRLCSDSDLLISGMLFHIARWQNHNWRNSRGVPLQYQELWRELLVMDDRLNIQWQWIKGHSRHPLQTRADALAYNAALTQRCNLQMAV